MAKLSGGEKMAQLVAESVNVVCPECAEPQPNPKDGSHIWLAEDFKNGSGVRKCVSCDEKLLISHHFKVQFPTA